MILYYRSKAKVMLCFSLLLVLILVSVITDYIRLVKVAEWPPFGKKLFFVLCLRGAIDKFAELLYYLNLK